MTVAPPGRAFTSGLSVNEFLLVRDAGFVPIAQVMGSSVYQVGWQALPATAMGLGLGWTGRWQSETVELEQRSEAWNEARRQALGRLADDAARVGAQAVVGVTVSRRRTDLPDASVEFIAMGTAVRSHRFAVDDAPVLSNLSGQEFSSLFRHGFFPVGLVAGSTVTYVASSRSQRARSRGLFTSMVNQELHDFSRGLYDSRALAMERVSQQAHALHAHGVVGVQVDRSLTTIDRDSGGTSFQDLLVEMHVLGTAIVELDRAAESPATYLDLQLNDPEGP